VRVQNKTSDPRFGGLWSTPLKQGKVDFVPLPKYSTDIAAAWEVVEEMELVVGYGLLYKWHVRNSWEDDLASVHTNADTAPLAICRAALKVVGA